MDEIDRELLSLLSTKIGMLMEDYSVKAIFLATADEEKQRAGIPELAKASNKIEVLVVAAQSIVE